MRRHTQILIALLIIFSSVTAQIKIHELSPFNLEKQDSLFFGLTSQRSVEPLVSGWQVFVPDEPERRIDVSVPCTFTGEEDLVFEKEFRLSGSIIKNREIELKALGVNYSAEVLLNEVSIYKHTGGMLPFSVTLPKDLLTGSETNKISIRVHNELSSNNTIPLNYRFLYPFNRGGIMRDVFLYFRPSTYFGNVEIRNEAEVNSDEANLSIGFAVGKTNAGVEEECTATVTVIAPENGGVVRKIETKVTAGNRYKNNYEIRNAVKWSAENPRSYRIRLELSRRDSLIDLYEEDYALVHLDNRDGNFTLNGKEFTIKGVTFNSAFGKRMFNDYKAFGEVISNVKNLGANTIRFAGELPHPYLLKLCQENGLVAMCELPLVSMPERYGADENFTERVSGILEKMIESYAGYGSFAALGLGSGYLGSSQDHRVFLSNMAGKFDNGERLFYASFAEMPTSRINGIDLYGLELYSDGEVEIPVDFVGDPVNRLGNENVFISEAAYPAFKGSSEGYLRRFSDEGQARFFENVINTAGRYQLSGFVFHSLYDYRGDFPSLYAGLYSDPYTYSLGIIGEENNTNTISYQLIKTKLTGGDKVTIPIGSRENDSPFMFILTGLILAVIVALLINSKRKFREDVTRAMLRPYNFFADIRDHRVLSGIQTSVLMLTLAGIHSLLLTNLLYYFRHNILLEKIVLAFGSPGFFEIIVYLSRNPLQALFYLFGFSLLLIFLFSIIIKGGSFFIRNRVMYSNIYYIIIWAFLPLVLLLPLELVLYQILAAGLANLYIFIFLGLYALWLMQRLLKGVFVIFDVNASSVYLYSFLFIIVVLGGLILFFQLTEASLYNITTAFRQYY